MAASDFLKKFRKDSYAGNPGQDDAQPEKPEEPEAEMSREIKLTDDEMKTFKSAKPGEDLSCEVHGSLESDGRFRVMSVSPMGGGDSYAGNDQQGMAQQIAQRVSPSVQISPS